MTSTSDADRSSCAEARAADAARSGWTTGAGNTCAQWLAIREQLPYGPLFCVIEGPRVGGAWPTGAARAALHRASARAAVRRRFAPHQLRHAHAIELAREGVPINIIQRQLGHSDLGVTSIYLQGIDVAEIIDTVHRRQPPMMPASVGLRLLQ